jgi:hypothetical protein
VGVGPGKVCITRLKTGFGTVRGFVHAHTVVRVCKCVSFLVIVSTCVRRRFCAIVCVCMCVCACVCLCVCVVPMDVHFLCVQGGWQLSALKWCSRVAHKPIVADGGIRANGDIAKSVRFGASMVGAR